MADAEPNTILLDAEGVAQAIDRLAAAIAKAHAPDRPLALLGILTRGRPIANRIADGIAKLHGSRPPVGSLATVLYRDDLRSGTGKPVMSGAGTHFDFDVNGMSIVLVDDVLNSGRTIRAAMDEVIDYGRPSRIQLACLIDRGLRELPIQADYLGLQIETEPEDHVDVRLRETDDEDIVILRRKAG